MIGPDGRDRGSILDGDIEEAEFVIPAKQWVPKEPTPYLAVDAIIRIDHGLVVINRKCEPLGLAFPGGFVNVGETTEQAVVREAKEETGLDTEVVCLLGVFSDPKRDPRTHVVSVAYILSVTGGQMKAGDDAADVYHKTFSEIEDLIKAGRIVYSHIELFNTYWKENVK